MHAAHQAFVERADLGRRHARYEVGLLAGEAEAMLHATRAAESRALTNRRGSNEDAWLPCEAYEIRAHPRLDAQPRIGVEAQPDVAAQRMIGAGRK